MEQYEIWGRKEWGKGKREKIAYQISTRDQAKFLRQTLIDTGYRDCVIMRAQVSATPDTRKRRKT